MEFNLINKLEILVAICNKETLSLCYSSTKFKALIGESGAEIFNLFESKYKAFSRQNLSAVTTETPYLFVMQLKDGRTRKSIEITISAYNEDKLMIVGKDITELKKLEASLCSYSSIMENQEKRLLKLAYTDSLTGISNRRAIFKKFNEYTKSNDMGSICIIDIDHFKKFNDLYGHDFGDYILKYFSENVALALDDDCYFARIGGEEFCVLSYTRTGAELNVLIDTVLQSIKGCDIRTPKENVTQIRFSAGITEYKKNGTTLDELLSNADKALYFAKETGRCRVISFSTELFEKRAQISAASFRETER